MALVMAYVATTLTMPSVTVLRLKTCAWYGSFPRI